MPKPHHKEERTFIIIKPDAIQRTLMGEIISRYERVGLQLVAMKMLVPTAEQIVKHYTLDPEWRRITGEKTIKAYTDQGKKHPLSDDPLVITANILEKLQKYMTSGPMIAMVWQGAHAVKIVRKITGGTEPLTSAMGTIRGDYVLDSYELSDVEGRSVRNLVHASGSVKEANDEIAHWFGADELFNYKFTQDNILYDTKSE